MILPHPESNLKINIMVLGSEIINIMNKIPFKNKFSIVDDIMIKFLKIDKNRTPDLFLFALTFLYLMGVIEKKGYKIKLIEKQESKQVNLSI